jgi:hypothetical protein
MPRFYFDFQFHSASLTYAHKIECEDIREAREEVIFALATILTGSDIDEPSASGSVTISNSIGQRVLTTIFSLSSELEIKKRVDIDCQLSSGQRSAQSELSDRARLKRRLGSRGSATKRVRS